MIHEWSYQGKTFLPTDELLESYQGFVYCLMNLKNGKKYIGKTTDIERRLNEHFTGNGAQVTKKFAPYRAEILETIPGYFADEAEQEHTDDNINKYGYDNVRGGIYNQLFLDKLQIKNINNEISFNNIEEQIEETYSKTNWLIEEDKYLYKNFIKNNNGLFYKFIDKYKRSYVSTIRRINNLKDVEHVSYKRLHNNNLEKIYKCNCCPNFIFENEKKYNNHLTNKTHIIYEKNEEIKELKILLTRRDNQICSLNCKIENLFNNTKNHLKEIEKLEQKILLIKENTNNNDNINILENIYNQSLMIGIDKTLINVLSIIIFLIITI